MQGLRRLLRDMVLSEGCLEVSGSVSSALLLALNATPQTVVAAPGAGKAVVVSALQLYKPAGVAYAGIAAGEDLALRYTDASGAIVAECETTGFLDQTTAQMRFVYPVVAGATAPIGSVTPVANSPLVLHMLVGEIITGDQPLFYKVWGRTINTVLS